MNTPDWIEVFNGYESELVVVVFSLALVAYVGIISIRFKRPYNHHGSKRLMLLGLKARYQMPVSLPSPTFKTPIRQ